MPLRTALPAAAVLAAALVVLPLAGVASAQPTTRDCRDFASQAAAESALRSGSGDPARLDPDGNGTACENYFTMAGPGGAVPLAADPAAPAAPVAPAADSGPAAVVPAPADPAPALVPEPALVPGPADPAPALVPAPDEPAPAALADAPVRTVPQPQILVKPQGAPDTGDGSSAPLDVTPLVLLVGGLGALAAAGAARRAR